MQSNLQFIRNRVPTSFLVGSLYIMKQVAVSEEPVPIVLNMAVGCFLFNLFEIVSFIFSLINFFFFLGGGARFDQHLVFVLSRYG